MSSRTGGKRGSGSGGTPLDAVRGGSRSFARRTRAGSASASAVFSPDDISAALQAIAQTAVVKNDAVTMTTDEDFAAASAAQKNRRGGGIGGGPSFGRSTFVSALFEKHQRQEEAEHKRLEERIQKGLERVAGAGAGGDAAAPAAGEGAVGRPVALEPSDLTAESSDATQPLQSPQQQEEEPTDGGAQQQKSTTKPARPPPQHQKAPAPRRMMRPSETGDTTNFPRVKRVSALDDVQDDEVDAIERANQRHSAEALAAVSGTPSPSPDGSARRRRGAGEQESPYELPTEGESKRVAEHMSPTKGKGTQLPDEVLSLVRKLRSASDIIGSSEGAPPPDALREIAVHSASLARFVSQWTLKQLSDQERHEASLHREWLTDAARDLRSRSEDFGWSTTKNQPGEEREAGGGAASLSGAPSPSPLSRAASIVLNETAGRYFSGRGNLNSSASFASAASAFDNHQSGGGRNRNNNSNNNNNNQNENTSAATAAAMWPRSYGAVSSYLGPWILSTLYLIMDSLLHTVQCDRGAIFVPSDDGRIVSACLVGAGGIARPIHVPRGQGVVGEVFRSGVAVNVLTTENAKSTRQKGVSKRPDQIFVRNTDNQTGFYTRNLLAVPVFAVGIDLVEQSNEDAEEQKAREAAMMSSIAGGGGGGAASSSGASPAATQRQQQQQREKQQRKDEANARKRSSMVGHGRVVAVIELINKLVPADGEFTPSDEMLVAQVGSVVASMLAACGNILQLGTESALTMSAELQAKLLTIRPAVIKARKQFLTATTGGCDSEETATGKFSFPQVLRLHEEQRARENRIALQLGSQTSATDLSRCGASNETIQEIFRVGGASTKVLRVGGDGGKNTEVERTLQDMASFVRRIEAAWANTRERCVMAESEVASSRERYNRLERQHIELKKLAHHCGILKDSSLLSTDALDGGSGADDSGGVSPSAGPSRRGSITFVHQQHHQQSRRASRATTLAGSGAESGSGFLLGIEDNSDDHSTARGGMLSSPQRSLSDPVDNDQLSIRSDDDGTSSRRSAGGRSSATRRSAGVGTKDHDDLATFERLLRSGDPHSAWESTKGQYLDFFQSRAAGYRSAAAIETLQARNLRIMQDVASTSTVGETVRGLEERQLADELIRAGASPAELARSAKQTRHRHRTHNNTTLMERAELDPLSVANRRLQEVVDRHEAEVAALLERQQRETRELYAELLAADDEQAVVANNARNQAVPLEGRSGFRLMAREFLESKKK